MLIPGVIDNSQFLKNWNLVLQQTQLLYINTHYKNFANIHVMSHKTKQQIYKSINRKVNLYCTETSVMRKTLVEADKIKKQWHEGDIWTNYKVHKDQS